MRFSEREGFKSVKNTIQFDSMDEELRTALWNDITFFYWLTFKRDIPRGDVLDTSENSELNFLCLRLWTYHLKNRFDTYNNNWIIFKPKLEEYFFACKWYEVYDFIEFVVDTYEDEEVNKRFIESCNKVLKRELSGYSLVGKTITKITSDEELKEIDDALKVTIPLRAVNTHLQTALKLMSNKKSPDYRNSIKESISAVESFCNLITGESKATLGQAIKTIEKKVEIHPALKKAFSNLYGYTSSSDGIRHGMLDESTLDFEDAKFMMVSCSAFINYLISKASKAGIKL